MVRLFLTSNFKMKKQIKIQYIVFISLVLSIGLFSCNKDKKEAELALIYSYIDANNLDVDTLSSGLLFSASGFSTLETLESDYPTIGDTVKTIHKAYVLIDKNTIELFEETTLEEPGIYVYKEDPVIRGWEEAMGLLKKDASALVIVPSKLAYKGDRVGIIPPYSPLVFEIRILDIVH